MTKRFIQLLWPLPAFVGSILLFCLPIGLNAQVNKFNFNYSGPSVVSAGPDCSQTLANAVMPLPTVTSTMGAIITMSMQDPTETTDNFGFNDAIPAPYTLLVGWLVKDNMGNSAFFYFPITIVDLTPPVFDLTNHPSTMNLGSVVQVPAAVNPPVTDNCTPSNQIVVTFSQTTPPDTCLAGTFTRTWKATDLVGNTTTFTQTINITADMLPPLVGSPPLNGSAPCAQLATAYPNWLATQLNTNFMVSDVSGIKSKTSNGPATFPAGCAMPLTVTFRATDNCNLFTTRTATFTTSDNTPPKVLTPARDTVGFCSPTNGQLLALGKWINKHGYQQSIDSCTLPSALVYSMQIGGVTRDSAQVVAALLASFANGCSSQTINTQMYDQVRGKVTVDFFVRDACGNQSPAGQATFIVRDTLPPVITGVNVTEECGGINDQTVLNAWINAHGNATATDDCSSTSWKNFSFLTSTGQTGNGNFNSGPYPTVVANNCTWYVDVTFRSMDECGNVGAKTLRFRITDMTVPVIAGFSPVVTVYCPNTAPANPTATASDNCDASVALVHSLPATTLLNCSGNYDVRFTWTATDDCGNTSTAIQTFQVRDTTGPVFTLVPAPKTFRCDTFVLPAPVVKGLNIDADDACSVVQQNITTQTISNQDPNPAVCGHYNYQITRIFTATDDCGNSRTATQVLTIVDNLGPVPTGTLDTTVVCEVTPLVSPPKALDACSGITAPPVFLNQVMTSGPCENNYLLTLNWRAQDVCGNTTLFSQAIHVHDVSPPTLSGGPANITVECDAIPPPPAISTFTTSDNCDQTVSVSLAETETRDPDPTHCAHWTNYQLHRTWTASDNCGNTSVYTQTIQIEDHTAPIITLPAAMQLPSDPGDCGKTMPVPAPLSVVDACTSTTNNTVLKDTVAITYPGGPIGTTPVDTIVLLWSGLNPSPGNPATGDATLTVYLDNVDSEDSTERFTILGENNLVLGLTNVTPVQCASSITTVTIPVAQLNAWLADGQLRLKLAPNGAADSAANPICPGGQVRATLSFPAAKSQVPVTMTYKLDNNPPAAYPSPLPVYFSGGTHTILYTATDCAGNSRTATLTVTILDTQPPVITAPAPLTGYVGQNNCLATVALPFPAITDNCKVSGTWSRSSSLFDIIFQNDPNAGTIPKNTNMLISGLIPNAVGPGKLTIRHKGDNAQNGEFFAILDENLAGLGFTTPGPVAGQCNLFHESSFTVTAAQINNWAINGVTSFRAVANNSIPAFNDFINPCAPLVNMMDGISQIQATLMYNYARIDYEIIKAGLTIQSDTLKGNQTTVTLPPGVYTVKYRVSDNSGVQGMTSFLLTVRDTVKPKAFCVSKTIQTNPSGVQTYTLLPSEINNNSIDNCSGTNLTFALSQTIFDCSQAPNSFPVTLTVTDTSGNSSACTALVKVETIVLHPYYEGVCEGGTLKLFTDPSLAAGNTIYTFMWSGPGGYVSFEQNPVIPAASNANEGTYVVKITGLTGCTATGSVIVDLLTLPGQPVLTANAMSYCEGSNIILSTVSYNGQNPTYQWYEGNQAGSVLLATTPASNYAVLQPSVGSHDYFVKVSGDGCISVNSNILTLQVYKKPTASVVDKMITVCGGGSIVLGTTVQAPGLTYAWTGPCGFTSNLQYPLPILNADPCNAGKYTLKVINNGCESDTVNVQVTVSPKPLQPQIVGDSKLCEGSPLKLIATNYAGNMPYLWVKVPEKDTVITTQNFFNQPNIMLADSGFWQLTVLAGGCYSDPSPKFLVQVQAYPDVTATSNSPLCTGQTLDLMATGSQDSLSWTWTGPGGFIRFTKNTIRKPAVPGMYKVLGKTSFGCADSAFVNVIIVPTPVIDTVTNNAPACVTCTTSATLQAVVQPLYGPLTYTWTVPGGSTITTPGPNLTIPGICDTNNGTYSLIVQDTFGCSSLPKTTMIDVQETPPTPNITPLLDSLCLGESMIFSITNANEFPANAQYIWTFQPTIGVSEIYIRFTPSLPIGPVSFMNSGTFTVQAQSGECLSPISTTAQLVVKPQPSAPLAIAVDSTLCEGETLQLFANPSSSELYDWISTPAGFSSTKPNPSISSVILSDARDYKVRRRDLGCWSGYSEPVKITVNTLPGKPTLLLPPAICKDNASTILPFNVVNGTAGAKYQFFDAAADTALAPPTTVLPFLFPDPSELRPGLDSFYVIAILGECSSQRSNIKTVQVDTIPSTTAYAGPDVEACITKPVILNGAGAGSGTWTPIGQSSSTIIVDPNLATTQVINLQVNSTYLYKWSLSNGACKNYSMDTVQVTTVQPEVAISKPLIRSCDTANVQLMATQGLSISGYWSQSFAQVSLGVTIADINSPMSAVHGLKYGNNYFFQWNLVDTSCGTTKSQTQVHVYSQKPYIGPDLKVCEPDSCTVLDAQTVLPNQTEFMETATWSSSNPGLIFTPANGEFTKVCNLQPGANVIYWTTNNDTCGSQSRDTMTVFFNRVPTANDDSINVPFGAQVFVDVLQNDVIASNVRVDINSLPANGTLIIVDKDKGQFNYQPSAGYTGTDQMVYRVCNIECEPEICVTATVKFIVGDVVGCPLPTLITPNDDNVNDVLVFPCLQDGDGQEDNELTVFNQWGNEVFHAAPYLNNWDGTNLGEDLPVGTYFYILKASFLEKPVSRFVLIQR